MRVWSAAFAACVASLLPAVAARAASNCEELKSLTLPHSFVTSAQTVATGAFTPPGAPGPGPSMYRSLPAFCRVEGVIS
jgi:hypothetical protein